MNDDRDFSTSFEELTPEKGLVRSILFSWAISLAILAGMIALLIRGTQWILQALAF